MLARQRPAASGARSSDPPLGVIKFRGRSISVSAALAWLVVLGFATVIAVRLGPALLGLKVLAGTDILMLRFPWSDAGPAPTPQNWYLGDSIDSGLVAYLQIHSRLWSGELLPLWTSLAGPGQRLAFIGNLPTLSPVAFGWLLFPTSYAVGFVKLTQLVAAFAGMALWLRRAGTSWVAGAFAGLLYVGSGFMSAWSNWTSQTTVACLIPALFWAVERFVGGRRTLTAALPIAVTVGFLMLGAFPAVAGHALYAAGAYFLVRLGAEVRTRGWRNSLITFAMGAGAVVLGVALSAVQFLPTLSAISEVDTTYRDLSFEKVQPFRSFLSLVFPQAMNEAAYPTSNPIEAYAFVGAATILLAGLAVLAARYTGARRGIITFLAVAALVSGALVWRHGWLVNWLGELPVIAGSNAGRIRDVVSLVLCALGGFGLELLVRSGLPGRVRTRLLIGSSVGSVVFLGLVWFGWRRYGFRIDPGTYVVDLVLGGGGVLLVTAAFVWFNRRAVRTALVAALICLTAVQSAVAMAYFYPLVDESTFYPDLPVIDATAHQVGGDRMLSIGGFPGSTASAYDIRSVTGHSFYPPTYAELLLTLDPEAFSKRGRSVTNPGLGLTPESGKLNNPLLDRMSVNTVYSSPGRAIPGDVHLTDGSAATEDPIGKRTTALVVGQPRTESVASQPVRAVRVWVAAQVGGHGSITLHATLSDPTSGQVVAQGSVTRGTFRAGQVDIPLPAEDIAAGGGDLELSLEATTSVPGFNPTIRLRADDVSVPRVRIVGTADDGLKMRYADSHGVVWERPSALPRIRWADTTIVATDRTVRLTHLVDPATPDNAVVLSAPAPAPADGKPATLTTLTDESDDVAVDVRADGAGYLVVADARQTGFVARVDGVSAPLVDAENAFVAVPVPAGEHRVEIRFNGNGFRVKLGLVVTLGAVIVLLALTFGGFWWQRRRRRAEDDGGPVGDPPAPKDEDPTTVLPVIAAGPPGPPKDEDPTTVVPVIAADPPAPPGPPIDRLPGRVDGSVGD